MTDLADDYDSNASSASSRGSSAGRSSSHGGSRRDDVSEVDVDDGFDEGQLPPVADAEAPEVQDYDDAVAGASTPVCAVRVRRLANTNLSSNASAGVQVTPFLVYHMLRAFGFPKRVLLFPQQQQQQFQPNEHPGQQPLPLASFYRGLAQFDSADACTECIEAFAAQGHWLSRPRLLAYCEVHLGGIDNDVFGVTLSRAEEQKVFATGNTLHSLIVTPSVIQPLGPRAEIVPLVVGQDAATHQRSAAPSQPVSSSPYMNQATAGHSSAHSSSSTIHNSGSAWPIGSGGARYDSAVQHFPPLPSQAWGTTSTAPAAAAAASSISPPIRPQACDPLAEGQLAQQRRPLQPPPPPCW